MHFTDPQRGKVGVRVDTQFNLLPFNRRFVSASEAARILAVSPETVREWFRTGKLEGVRINGHTIRLYTDSVNKLVVEGGVK